MSGCLSSNPSSFHLVGGKIQAHAGLQTLVHRKPCKWLLLLSSQYLCGMWGGSEYGTFWTWMCSDSYILLNRKVKQYFLTKERKYLDEPGTWVTLDLMTKRDRASRGSVCCRHKSVRAWTATRELSSEHWERRRVLQSCHCYSETVLNFFQLQTVSHPKRSSRILRNPFICLITCPIDICRNRCSRSKGF